MGRHSKGIGASSGNRDLEIGAKLERARGALNRGETDAAIRICKSLLRAYPNLFDAQHFLGFAYASQGSYEAALDAYSKALNLGPATAELQNNRAIAYAEQGAYVRALECLALAIELDPDYADAWLNRGITLARQGNLTEAYRDLRRANEIRPSHPVTLNQLALVLVASGNLGQAESLISQAIELAPDRSELWANLSGVLVQRSAYEQAIVAADKALAIEPANIIARRNRSSACLGLGLARDALADAEAILQVCPDDGKAIENKILSLESLGQFEEALSLLLPRLSFEKSNARLLLRAGSIRLAQGFHLEAIELLQQSLQLEPNDIEALGKLGSAQIKSRDYMNASATLKTAIALSPNNSTLRNNLAVLDLYRRQNWRGILELRRTLKRDPNNADVLSNLAWAYMKWGRMDDVERYLAHARRIRNDHVDVWWNSALARLAIGDLETGWDWYEWRRKKDFWRAHKLAGREVATTSDLYGRVYLYAEQGLGDTIQFARYAEIVAEHAESVQLAVQRPLTTVLSGLKKVRVIGYDDKPDEFDVHLPLMSVPRILGTRLDTVPARVPYIFADPERAGEWQKRIGRSGYRVGIAWQGNPHNKIDEGRSFPVRVFEKVSRIPGVRLISLQKNAGAEQLIGLPHGMVVETLGPDFDSGDQAFVDTAAVMSNLDLIITSDTAIAHLAGALGCPVWIALQFSPDWRWHFNRNDSPWYPSATLFRQEKPGDWGSVFEKIEANLRERTQQTFERQGQAAPIGNSGRSEQEVLEAAAMAAMGEGDFARVLEVCDQIKARGESNGLVNHMVAHSNAELGRHEEAVESYIQTIRAIPRADIYADLSASLNALGRFSEGLQAANEALARAPNYINALINRSQSLIGLERFREALEAATVAASSEPAVAAVWVNIATSHNGLQNFAKALEAADRAVSLGIGEPALNNRAVALAGMGRLNDAVDIWESILKDDPNNTIVLAQIIRALADLNLPKEALKRAEPGLGISGSRTPTFLTAVAVALLGDGQFEQAAQYCREAVGLSPNDWRVRSVLGSALYRLGLYDEAKSELEHAHRLRPDDNDIRRNLAHLALLQGAFEEGWKLFEGRRKGSGANRQLSGVEIDSVHSLRHKRIFLYAEQGLGDTIQFARYAEMIAEEADLVELEVQAPLVALLSRLHRVHVIGPDAEPAPYDMHLPLMSAPFVFGTRIETIPQQTPYVFADPNRVVRWEKRLGLGGFKIGICWQANPNAPIAGGKSFPLSLFTGMASIPGVRLISLQKHHGLEQLAYLPTAMSIETLGDDFDAGGQAFLDTAAVISGVDLVISCDTAIAHLAGAMGKPVWIALQKNADWRWLLQRTDSPWYPTAKLFRQVDPGSWTNVFKDMEDALQTLVAGKR